MNIIFTPSQCAAIKHRLAVPDCLEDVFADTDGLEHLAPQVQARANEMMDELMKGRSIETLPDSELDREILRETIEGSTYAACCDDGSEEGKAEERRARSALKFAARAIENYYNLPAGDIEVPQA
jgi:hypothetical protein